MIFQFSFNSFTNPTNYTLTFSATFLLNKALNMVFAIEIMLLLRGTILNWLVLHFKFFQMLSNCSIVEKWVRNFFQYIFHTHHIKLCEDIDKKIPEYIFTILVCLPEKPSFFNIVSTTLKTNLMICSFIYSKVFIMIFRQHMFFWSCCNLLLNVS